MIAVVLCIVGLFFVRNRPEFMAFAAVGLSAALLTFVEPAIRVMNALPGLHAVRWPRAGVFVVLAVAVLGGVGVQAIMKYSERPRALAVAGIGFGSCAVLLALLWLILPYDDNYRTQGFIWGAASCTTGLLTIGYLAMVRRGIRIPRPKHPGVVAASVLVAFETVFLVALGIPLMPSSSALTTTQAVSTLEKTVGTARVATGTADCASADRTGIMANANILFGVRELSAYDPLLPNSLYTAWFSQTNTSPGYSYVSTYCPGVSSAALARLYGVSYILERHGAPAPTGASFDRRIGGEDLYYVSGVGAATVVPLARDGAEPSLYAGGYPVAVHAPTDRSMRIDVVTGAPSVLRVRLLDVPGWHATIDGRPLPLQEFAGVMMQAHIPPGRHIVKLDYWPSSFSLGIVLAGLSALGLLAALIVAQFRRRRSPTPPRQPSTNAGA